MLTGNSLAAKAVCVRPHRFIPTHFEPQFIRFQGTMKTDLKLTRLLGSSPPTALDELRTTRTNHRVDRSLLCVPTRFTAHLRRE
jgi:hypothetical protein